MYCTASQRIKAVNGHDQPVWNSEVMPCALKDRNPEHSNMISPDLLKRSETSGKGQKHTLNYSN